MAVELTRKQLLSRPWGVGDLSPWHATPGGSELIGEIHFERPGTPATATEPALLLKLLFTNQPLSIQVHPDDAAARAMGESNGKSEAWYVLSAAPEAKVALGLNERRTPQQLRQAAQDGSLAGLVTWQSVSPDDVIFVPAGTIHALGAGLVIAEIQQRSNVTFRLFDHGRPRELHIERAVAIADTGPAASQPLRTRFSAERSLLVSCPHFVFERIDLPVDTTWCLEAERETWLLILSGRALVGAVEVWRGDAVFAESDRIDIRAGEFGVTALVAYSGSEVISNLLQRCQASAVGGGIRAVQSRAAPRSFRSDPGLDP